MARKIKRLITSALPYVNNVPHIGNIVGSHLPADIFARYCRIRGYDTLFIGGTDEHGTPIALEAEKKGKTPRELADFFYKIHRDIYKWLNISYDNFSRTSREVHYKTTQDFFKVVYKNGWIIEKEASLAFCASCQRFLPDRYIEGTCPFCGYKGARGDQCEKCGRLLDPVDLKDPYCAICNSKEIEFRKSKHLFLDLTRLSGRLKKWIKARRHWRDQVKALALGWIKEGLKPRSITRDIAWGIPVPLKGYEDKVFYVWFDAPIGYISSTKEILEKGWKNYWQKKDCQIFHFVGKDNIAFHTIFWPGSLLAHGSFNLPYNVVGLQYLNFEGKKISKSRKWGVFANNLPLSGLSPDYWRFYLSFLIPETADTNFKWEEFRERINSDLIGGLANFVHRTLSIVYNKFDGRIKSDFSNLDKQDKIIIQKFSSGKEKVEKLFEAVDLRLALREIFSLVALANKYFDYKKPWVLVKSNKDEAEKTLGICLNMARSLALLISPFLPDTSSKIFNQLSLKKGISIPGLWEKAGNIDLIKKFAIKKPEILFQKIEPEDIERLKKKTSEID